MTKALFIISLFFLSACSTQNKDWTLDINPHPGLLTIVQTATNETDTYINIIKGREAEFSYHVELGGQKVGVLRKYKTVKSGQAHLWVIDKIHISRLKPNVIYELVVTDDKYKNIVERRHFSTLNLDKKNVQFVVASCMSDNHRYKHIRDRIWQQIENLNPDIIFLIGDNVYVDDIYLVSSKSVNSFEIWQRYFDSLREIPLYHQKKLTPVFATWDDHDFGSNNSSKNFPQKNTTKKVYQAFFNGEELNGTYEKSKNEIYSEFKGFGHRFLILDNRFFREESSSKKNYAYFGWAQQQWLLKKLKGEKLPTWMIAGGQFFAPVFKLKNGKQVNESFMMDYPNNFKLFMKELTAVDSPLAFLSGDVHFSEVMEIEKDFLGYKTYEITSSPIHSYLFRANENQEEFFPNPRRMVAVKDYNFIYIDSYLDNKNEWHINLKSIGPKQEEPFFSKNLIINK